MLKKNKLTHIRLSGTMIPLACNLNVLEVIQDEYVYVLDGETVLSSFQQQLGAYRFQKDERGQKIYDKEGRPLIRDVEIHIPTVKKALFWMASEGFDVEGKEPIGEEDLIRMVDISPFDLTAILYLEFARCVAQKKEEPTQKAGSPEKAKMKP